MNRRHEPLSCQMQKKSKKAVREGIKEETPAEKSLESAEVQEIVDLKGKKTSKRTNLSGRANDSTPNHALKEGNRWVNMLQKQTEENNLRLRQHQDKTTSLHH